DEQAVAVLDHVPVVDLDLGVVGRLDRGLLGAALGRAADVERAHRELGTRLADRLRGDDADGLADVDARAAREVTAVAGRADAALGRAGQHRADADRLEAGALDRLDAVLVDDLARRDQQLAGK